jgi:hypothetical protein
MDYTEAIVMNHTDVLRERQKLMDLLKIPISSLVFSRFYCELLLSQHSLGFLPISQSSSGIQYENGKTSLQKLNWPKVYSLHQAELHGKIEKQIRIDSFHAVPISFRRLYIEDQHDQLIASFECTYENFSWNVRDEKILAPATV